MASRTVEIHPALQQLCSLVELGSLVEDELGRSVGIHPALQQLCALIERGKLVAAGESATPPARMIPCRIKVGPAEDSGVGEGESDPSYGGSEGDRWSVQGLLSGSNWVGHKVLGVFEDLDDALRAMKSYLLHGGPWAGCANKPVLRLVREQACQGITPVGGWVTPLAAKDDVVASDQEPQETKDEQRFSLTTMEEGQCCKCGHAGMLCTIRTEKDEWSICRSCLLACKGSE